ncbi:unnamed protein product [Adineta steineri]|uniref:Tetraspanin n=1 Tax=Adineta steineri TaxID=433720 RepID=A0A819TNR5_9BILA|nr:unnamed protein product [Adineta steineri]
MDKSTLKLSSKIAVFILCILGLIELALALWTVLDKRYRTLAYNLADVGYIDLWILRYLSLCLFASSIITLFMCLILIWGLFSAHAFLFIASTMILIICIGELTISILTFASKYETRLTLIEQLPKLVITYRQGTDERAKRALDILQMTFYCCGAEGRLSYQNNVPLSCNMFSVGCLIRTMYFLDYSMDTLAYISLFFSLIKLFIVLFFYSFLCIHYQDRRNRLRYNYQPSNESQLRHQLSSYDSSSTENLPRKPRIPTTMTDQDDDDDKFLERQYVSSNTYGSSSPSPSSSNKRIQNASTIIVPALMDNNDLIAYYEKQNASRKLSSISEKTEKTETDDSESDNLRLKYYKQKPITSIDHDKQYRSTLLRKLPPITPRRKIQQDDDNDNDSGVERSSSEKSFEDHRNQKQYFDSMDITPEYEQTNKNTSSLLNFSNIFLTSTSQFESTDNQMKQPLKATSSFDHLLRNDSITPKPILKKSSQQRSPTRILPNNHNQKQVSSMYTKTTSLLKNNRKLKPKSYLKQNENLI